MVNSWVTNTNLFFLFLSVLIDSAMTVLFQPTFYWNRTFQSQLLWKWYFSDPKEAIDATSKGEAIWWNTEYNIYILTLISTSTSGGIANWILFSYDWINFLPSTSFIDDSCLKIVKTPPLGKIVMTVCINVLLSSVGVIHVDLA